MSIKLKKVVDRRGINWYNVKAVRNAAIAQQVERILGKDEVSSSNLDSSSKSLDSLRESRLFLCFCAVSQTASFFTHFRERMRSENAFKKFLF